MNSLHKKVSMSQLYSDLEKFESNLNSAKQSRIKKDFSTSSLHKAPSRSITYKSTNVSKFEKPKVPTNSKSRIQRNNYGKLKIEQKYGQGRQSDYRQIQKISRGGVSDGFEKSSFFCSSQPREKYGKENEMFSKKDQTLFLKECHNLYGTRTIEEEVDPVKVLLKQINKRDELYENVTKKLGSENITEKLSLFFKEYDTMKSIIDEFKKMSKLDIEDYDELFTFLKSETDLEEVEAQKQYD